MAVVRQADQKDKTVFRGQTHLISKAFREEQVLPEKALDGRTDVIYGGSKVATPDLKEDTQKVLPV